MVIKPPINNNNKPSFLSHIMPDRGGQSPNAHLIVAASAGEDRAIIAITPNTNNTGPFKNERSPKINDKKVFTKEVAKFNIIISPNKACSSLLKVTCLGSDLIPMILYMKGTGLIGMCPVIPNTSYNITSSLRSK